MRVNPKLAGIWLTGWALARRTPMPVNLGDCWRVDVGWPDQKARYVFATPSERLPCLAAIAEPHVFLKTFLPVDAMASLLPPGWSLDPQRVMMIHETLAPAAACPARYRLQQDGRAAEIFDGDIAVSSGQVVVEQGWAIFDSIKVDPGHRRRGLGRALMGILAGMARDLGARQGVLVATQEDRMLYHMLGWRDHALYASAFPSIQR